MSTRHPHEPARGTPRCIPTEWPSGRHREPVPAPPQLRRLLGLTVASGALHAALGLVVTVVYATPSAVIDTP